MATQNRDLYDEDEIRAIQREYGIPTVGAAMESAVEETKDVVVSVATDVAEAPAKVFSFLERGGGYYIAGFISGVIATVVIRLLP